MIDCVPCPACGAWAGEQCHRLYRKDGQRMTERVYSPDHHMARCSLWHAIKFWRGETNASVTGRCRNRQFGGCTTIVNDIIEAAHHDDRPLARLCPASSTPSIETRFPSGVVVVVEPPPWRSPWPH